MQRHINMWFISSTLLLCLFNATAAAAEEQVSFFASALSAIFSFSMRDKGASEH